MSDDAHQPIVPQAAPESVTADPPGAAPEEGTVGVAPAAARPTTLHRRRRQIVVLVAIIALLGTVSTAAGYYLLTRKPLPIPDIVDPTSALPHYMYSIYGVDKPIGVAVTPDGGHIYVTESANQHLLRVLDAGGTSLAEGSPPGSTATSRVPVYDARDPLTGEIYVTDRLSARIDIYDAAGIYQRVMTRPATISLWRPLGIAFDDTGMLFVSDVSGDSHRVYEIDREGQVVRTIVHDGNLQYPNGIAPAGDAAYITDSNNGQLVRAPLEGASTVVVGRGIAPGDLSLPRGVALDDGGRMYVTDVLAHSVYVYKLPTERATRPTFLGSFGEEGSGDGQFRFPNGVAADARGHLFVSDQENDRIQVWGY